MVEQDSTCTKWSLFIYINNITLSSTFTVEPQLSRPKIVRTSTTGRLLGNGWFLNSWFIVFRCDDKVEVVSLTRVLFTILVTMEQWSVQHRVFHKTYLLQIMFLLLQLYRFLSEFLCSEEWICSKLKHGLMRLEQKEKWQINQTTRTRKNRLNARKHCLSESSINQESKAISLKTRTRVQHVSGFYQEDFTARPEVSSL